MGKLIKILDENGDARITNPLSYNFITVLKDAIHGIETDTFFFYLGE